MFGCVEWRWMNTSSELTKTIIVVLSAVCWAVLVVLWESQVQLRLLWCGRNWFESVPRAVQMLRSVPLMKTVVCEFTDYRVLLENVRCEYLKSLFLTLITCRIPFIIPNFFFFNMTNATPHPPLAGSDTHSCSDSEQDWSRFRRQTLNSLKRRLALR